ncbi:MAG TPA: hypothetical protein VFE65_33245 [Pseudonocardia sp.]|jgi:hypothetical protein|nr:hypothetical protein [Pseudonocardia sp.]
MTIDGLSTLSSVRAFLMTEVLPAVPDELAGELRAAAKLLAGVETELDTRYSSLATETRDLIAHAADAARLLGLDEAASACERLAVSDSGVASARLTELESRWSRARQLSSTLLRELQGRESDPAVSEADRRAARALLREFYTSLTSHARTRLDWQAVFPVPAHES